MYAACVQEPKKTRKKPVLDSLELVVVSYHVDAGDLTLSWIPFYILCPLTSTHLLCHVSTPTPL